MKTKPLHKKMIPVDSFLDLVREFPLRPIRSPGQYEAAAAMIDRLALREEASLNEGEADYLETLEMLVDAYDDDYLKMPVDTSTSLDRLKYLLSQTHMRPAQLGDLLGSRPAATLILQGARELSKAHIRKLAEYFKVDAGYFL